MKKKSLTELENDNVGSEICKKMITDNREHYCKKWKIYLGDENYSGNLCKVCKESEAEDFDELMEEYEKWCMRRYY